MAQTAVAPTEPPCASMPSSKDSCATFISGQNGVLPTATESFPSQESVSAADDEEKTAHVRRRLSRRVVPGLPRAQTFKRQQSEQRNNLAPAQLSADERRAVSVDRRALASRALSQPQAFPRTAAPDPFSYELQSAPSGQATPLLGYPEYSLDGMLAPGCPRSVAEDDSCFADDAHSLTTSAYDAMINEELERTWILNLSMHFRDQSKREKFFVTYHDRFKGIWRRVTISLDYRNAPENSLEMDLAQTKYQREKSAKIYEAIRESLQDIQFYDTVTNLKLQTTDGRLHVHVVEDVNEIISYPRVRQIQHLGCPRIREKDIQFDSHMSGFVYRVNVGRFLLVKKEIPGPETVDEFLYEINALSRLRFSKSVIRFYGVVVDDRDEYVKGLLISHADQGALIDVIYDNRQDSELGTPWPIRERWARQIVEGLADIHESGFVQGDFTLSNIVVDHVGDAKIIDINRRGCPVGWEPPEATALIESGQRLSMYIGVKSDLYQLGMVLWSLATQEDNPEDHGRPLVLEPDVLVPDWYRQVVKMCLSEDPRMRPQASTLLSMFPQDLATVGDEGVKGSQDDNNGEMAPPTAVNQSSMRNGYLGRYGVNGEPHVTAVNACREDWPYTELAQADDGYSYDPYYFTRGRSPPRPLAGPYPYFGPLDERKAFPAWAGAKHIAPSYSDVGVDEVEQSKSVTPTTSRASSMAEPLDDTTPTIHEGSLEQAGHAVGTTSTSPTTQNTSFDSDVKLDPTDISELVPSPGEEAHVGHVEPTTDGASVSGSDMDPTAAVEGPPAPSYSEAEGTDANSDMSSLPHSENPSSSQRTEQKAGSDSLLEPVEKPPANDVWTELGEKNSVSIGTPTDGTLRAVERDSSDVEEINEKDTDHADGDERLGTTAPAAGEDAVGPAHQFAGEESPGAEHPELKGVGAAHVWEDAAARQDELSLDDDSMIVTTSATATTKETK